MFGSFNLRLYNCAVRCSAECGSAAKMKSLVIMPFTLAVFVILCSKPRLSVTANATELSNEISSTEINPAVANVTERFDASSTEVNLPVTNAVELAEVSSTEVSLPVTNATELKEFSSTEINPAAANAIKLVESSSTEVNLVVSNATEPAKASSTEFVNFAVANATEIVEANSAGINPLEPNATEGFDHGSTEVNLTVENASKLVEANFTVINPEVATATQIAVASSTVINPASEYDTEMVETSSTEVNLAEADVTEPAETNSVVIDPVAENDIEGSSVNLGNAATGGSFAAASLTVCELQEVCEGTIEKCFPCKHGGTCRPTNAVSPSLSNVFTCDCDNISYVGEYCQFAQGQVDLRLLSADPFRVLVGREESYEVVIKKKGDKPRIIVDMGDGFHFSIAEHSIIHAFGSGSSNGFFVYKFTHKFTKAGEYTIRAIITNGEDSISNEKIGQVNPIYLSEESSKAIVATYKPDICLPDARLINVGPTIDEATLYTRKDEFTIESVIEPNCEILEFKFVWKLHKLDLFPFPTPSPENNWHIEKIEDDHALEKSVTFKPRVLGIGRYAIEYQFFVDVNGINISNSAKGYFNIELNPPKIVIHGGSEKSVDVSQDTLLDASGSLDEGFPELSKYLSFQWSCPLCNLGGPWKVPALTITAGSLTVGGAYDFHLDVSLEHDSIKRSTMTSVRLIGSTASLQINCIKNCDRMNPGDEILLQCTCVSCASPPAFEFSWESADGVIPIIKKDKPFTGILLPNVVLGNRSRTVICRTTNPNLVAKLNVKVNTAPSGGDCGIQPNKGTYLKTAFSITCDGFLDDNVPLEYSFYANTDGDQGKDIDQKLYLLAHDTNPRAINVYLPYNPSGGDTVVSVKVTDRLGLSTIKEIKVAVELPDDEEEYPDLLAYLVSEDDSLMKRRKKFGDDQGALQLQLVVLHGLLDNKFSGLHIEDVHDLWWSITSVLTEVPQHSFKAVEQTLQSLYLLKQLKYEEDIDSLLESSIVFFHGASRFVEFVLSDNQIIPTEIVMILARDAAVCAGILLRSSHDQGIYAIDSQPMRPSNDRMLTDFDSTDDIGRDYFLEVHELQDDFKTAGESEVQENLAAIVTDYARISHLAFMGLEHLLDAVGERLEEGHEFIFKTEELTLFARAEMEIESIGLSIPLETGSGKAQLTLPGTLQKTLSSQGISEILIQITEVLSNPYFDDPSAIPGTPILSLLVKDRTPRGERLPIHLESLEEPVQFDIPLTPTATELLDQAKSKRSVLLKPLDDMSKSDLTPFHLLVLHNTRVEITILDYLIDLEFVVVVSKDYWPTNDDYCDPDKIQVLNQVNNEYSTHFYSENLSLNVEPKEHFLEYYVGIYPFRPKVFNKRENYSVYFTRNSCLFRDENKKFWSEGGCIVGNESTATALHCICNHASIFAGTQFTIPSTIPTISLLDFNPEEFEKNSVVLVTVITALCGYFGGMLICWFLDRRDKKHIALTIMSDVGSDSDFAYYLVTISTGSRFQSGTTANVSIQLYGSKNRSPVYVLKEDTLKDKYSPVLNRGGTDSFLVSSAKDLGDLEKIRVWHDNFGDSPNWFCRKIAVQDVKSDREWLFFIDRWLQVSGAESTIILECNVATETDHEQFSLHFHENLIHLMDNSLWVSVFWCRTASKFTRCQRLSRAFAVLTFYMLLNILIWSGKVEDEDDECNYLAFLYAFVISIIALPLGLSLLFFFRCIRRRSVPTLIVSGLIYKPKPDASIRVPMKSKTHYEQRNPIFENDQSMNLNGAGDKALESDASSNFSIPSTNIDDLESWLEHPATSKTGKAKRIRCINSEKGMTNETRIALDSTRNGLVDAIKAVDADCFIFPGDQCISEVEDRIDDEIKSHFIKANAEPSFNKVKLTYLSDQKTTLNFENGNSISDNDEVDPVSNTNAKEEQCQGKQNLKFEACEMRNANNKGLYFPWWFIFISWSLCLGTICLCLYFTLIYGQEVSYSNNISWLIGVISGMCFSLLIAKPVNAVVWAVLLAACRAKSTKLPEKKFQIFLKEEEDLREYGRKLNFAVFCPTRMCQPLSGSEILRFRVEAKRRENTKRVTLKVLLYVFILIPLLVVAYAGFSKDMYMVVQNLRRVFKLHNIKQLYGKLRSFEAVSNEEKLLEYLDKIFIPAVYPEELYNGNRRLLGRFDPSYLDDGQSLLVGVPRIRQVRVRPGSCNVPSSVEKTFTKCFSAYSASTRDTETYNPLWRPVINGIRSKPSKTNDIWKFQEFDPDFIRSLPVRGDLGIYDGGGYVVELGRRRRESLSVLRYLDRSRWIDHQTRGVFIEFTVWNPNVDVYADVVLVFERGAAEFGHPSYHITPLFLSLADCFKSTPWVSLSYGVLFVSWFVLVAVFCWNIFSKTQLRVYGNMWFWMDFLVIVSLLVSLSIAGKTRFVVAETVLELEGMKINQYLSLQRVAYWNDRKGNAFSITQCICFLKICRVFIGVEKRFYLAYLTVNLASNMIMAYFVVILIILVAFSCAGHFIFGNDLLNFGSFGDTLKSLGDQSLNVDFFLELQANHRFLGPIYSVLFGFIVTNVCINLLVYIMNLSLHNAKRISREKNRKWNSLEATRRLLLSRSHEEDGELIEPPFEISPDRLKEMKQTTAKYYRECLKSNEAKTLSHIKRYTDQMMQGTGYHFISRQSRRYQEELTKESHIVEMRTATAVFLISKIGAEITAEEFENYADVNREIIWLRLHKMEIKLAEINRKVRGLNELENV